MTKLTSEQQKLVADNIGLVGVHLRNRVPTPPMPTRNREYEDLFQEGCVALARAAARYNPKRHGAFAAYAFPRIRAAVFEAIYRQFTVVPVPWRVLEEMREKVSDAKLLPPHHVQELTGDIARGLFCWQPSIDEDDSIRHCLHKRFRAAVDRALAQLRAQHWRYRDPTAIMDRIARERLLLSDERERTPLRRIAREMGVSSGRANDYEKLFLRTISQVFASDPHVCILVEMAGESPDGFATILDAALREQLHDRLTRAFIERFEAMEPPARAEAIYSLIERSAESVPEVAKNLYRLALGGEAA